MSTQVATAIGAHLVGGLKAPDAEQAMRTACRILGDRLYAVPDGETGERNQWIGWQLGRLTAIDGIEMAGTRTNRPGDKYSEMPVLAVDAGVTELPAGALGYADAAAASYEVFKRLRAEGAIPEQVRFQVSVPTPYATVAAWVRSDDQERFFGVYQRALEAEIEQIGSAVATEDLSVQHDVAVEVGVLTGDMGTADALGRKEFVVDALRRAVQTPAAAAERGLHLCYGDYGHRHFRVPDDLALCVELANAVAGDLDFVHMPADRDSGRAPGYYEPLRDLRTRGRLALGVIDYEGSPERIAELLAAADEGGGGVEFAVATECGMARVGERHAGEPTLEELLDLHARFSQPVR